MNQNPRLTIKQLSLASQKIKTYFKDPLLISGFPSFIYGESDESIKKIFNITDIIEMTY